MLPGQLTHRLRTTHPFSYMTEFGDDLRQWLACCEAEADFAIAR